ncbi:MAG: septation protein SepH [Arachnia sp.]
MNSANSALSQREIQARLRAGASVPEVAAEAGVEVSRIEGFALPVMAERAHMTRTALGASVRRRGDGSGHRRLGEIVRERLQARSLDSDTVEWDAWRQNDLKWRLVGLLDDQAASRAAEFVFDPKGQFSVADNADARWMIGEALPLPRTDPDNENTIDFKDELALVRAMSDEGFISGGATGAPGDEVPPHGSQYEGAAHTSELDELYDMLSGVSEDSVRIYLGLDDAKPIGSRAPEQEQATAPPTAAGSRFDDEPEVTLSEELSEHPDLDNVMVIDPVSDGGEARVDISASSSEDESHADGSNEASAPNADEVMDAQPAAANESLDHTNGPDRVPEHTDASVVDPEATVIPADSPSEPEQDALVPDPHPAPPKRKPAKKRASIPSWDEIMFGGPSRG